MKRRDFLSASAGLASLTLPGLLRAQSLPCPPVTIGVDGGQPVSTDCTPATAELDWQARINGPGVVWYHDFRSATEVNAFRWCNGYVGGNDPQAIANNSQAIGANVRWINTDGPTGACMEILHPVGSKDGMHWWRPFSPLRAGGNGRTLDDPGAVASIARGTWAPTDGGMETAQWSNGWWGHPDSGGAAKDGHDFYVQVRCKMDPRRISGGNASFSVGKFIWFTTCQFSLSDAELVTYSYGDGGNQGSGKNYFRLYQTNVTGHGYFDPLNPGNEIQPGDAAGNVDWFYSGGWDTLLYHLRLGRPGVASGADATFLEVWAAHPGQSSYTKIWTQTYGISGYESGGGLQALMFSTFNNGNNFSQQFYHRYAQLIFSKDFIPAPQA